MIKLVSIKVKGQLLSIDVHGKVELFLCLAEFLLKAWNRVQHEELGAIKAIKSLKHICLQRRHLSLIPTNRKPPWCPTFPPRMVSCAGDSLAVA